MTNITEYQLPVNQPKRNFPPVREEHFVGPEDFKQGDTEGVTETDSKTDPGEGKGRTRVNKMRGKPI